jgi:hypothetical protein
VEDDLVVGTESVVPLDPPLLESVLRSVRNEALDRLRRSFRNEGAIIHLGEQLEVGIEKRMYSTAWY